MKSLFHRTFEIKDERRIYCPQTGQVYLFKSSKTEGLSYCPGCKVSQIHRSFVKNGQLKIYCPLTERVYPFRESGTKELSPCTGCQARLDTAAKERGKDFWLWPDFRLPFSLTQGEEYTN